MTPTLFESPTYGTCIYCGGETDLVVLPSGTMAKDVDLGVCDVCSYGLAHFWRASRGERDVTQSPRLVKTYLLVPALPKGRAPEDVSAYRFLVDEDGGLPWLHYVRDPQAAVGFLEREHGVATWAATTRLCYLGYDARADFSEVRLAWAWGRATEHGRKDAGSFKLKSFAELISPSTPDAGFYLAVKQAFEQLLAQRELSPESVRVCVQLREPAMRYVAYQNYDSGLAPCAGREDEDESMVELCHAAMTSEELAVAGVLEAAARGADEGKGDGEGASVSPVVRRGAAAAVAEQEGEGEGEDDAEEEPVSEDRAREGFARPPKSLTGGKP